jgi:uncharacterized protein YutE (UPF0331/DUF86 family)
LLDKNLILRKLSELEDYQSQLKEYKNITVHAYHTDWKVQRIIERTLQLMIEICVDISHHIISAKKYRIPTSYADTFLVLFEQQVFDEALLGRLQQMAKFRNILVHNYEKVDPEIVIPLLKQNLNDFTLFRISILEILKNSITE